MADSLADLFAPYAGVSAALPESSVTPNRPPPDVLLHSLASMFTLPQRAIESAANYQQGGGYDPAPIVDAAMLPMGAGAGGVPMRAGEAVFGAGPVRGAMERYNQALAEGRITPAEHAGFAEALGPAFPDKAAGRTEKNLTTRLIDKYWQKQQAWQDGTGPALTPAERAEWQAAFSRKTDAQRYLVSTQPAPTEDEIITAIRGQSDGR
jgi:hypothetical protein